MVCGNAETGTEALDLRITATKLGRIVSVCIPYHMAAPIAVQPRPKPWFTHLAFLNGLKDFLARLDRNIPVVIAGDFNQRTPRIRTPHAFHDVLLGAIDGYQVTIRGANPGIGAATIDHIVRSLDLVWDTVSGISNLAANGKQLSSHFGVAADLKSQ